jgi:hypothetical protein
VSTEIESVATLWCVPVWRSRLRLFCDSEAAIYFGLLSQEANIYKAQKDFEGSATSGIEAYKIARVIQSPKSEKEGALNISTL